MTKCFRLTLVYYDTKIKPIDKDFILNSHKTTQVGKIQTVLGQIEPKHLGFTIMHEHVLSSLNAYKAKPEVASDVGWVNAPIKFNNIGQLHLKKYINQTALELTNIDDAISEVSEFKISGGNSIVDTTSRGIGRDPRGLALVSRATGAHIVMGAGYYVPLSYPEGTRSKSENELISETVSDIVHGVKDTGIKSGIIGEIGLIDPIDKVQERILRSAAQASKITGCPITIHPPLNDTGALDIMKILLDEGVAPCNIIIGHLGMAMVDQESVKELGATGCYLQYDHFGSFEDSLMIYKDKPTLAQNDNDRLESLRTLVELGYEDRLLVSQDVCIQIQRIKYGGKGYAHLVTNIADRMISKGLDKSVIKKIFIENPSRILTFKNGSI